MVQERRQHQRLAPSSPQLVLVDESKYSLLFDLSEGGLAVEGFSAQDPNRPISLEFDMPEGSCCIQAKAEIVWTSDSGYRTGFRFLDLPEASRQQLRNWISTTSAARIRTIESEVPASAFGIQTIEEGAHAVGVENANQRKLESFAFPLQPALKPRPHHPFAGQDEEFNSESSALHLASIFVAAVVMSSLAFILGYYWHAGRPRPRPKSITVAAQPFGHPAEPPAPAAAQQSPAETAIPPILPLENPGFVLQVGAMGQEANADALSGELRKKNFSAFVFHRGTDHFYRVAVGPYTDQGAAIRIKNDLEQEGYKPILRPWSPQ